MKFYNWLITKSKKTFLIYGLIALFTVLYVSLIWNNNIWTDEAFTLQLLRTNSLREITAGTANDVHPPLYYYWAYLFQTLFGDSLQVQKIAAILPQVGLFLYMATVVRRHLGDGVAFLSILFLACIPCSMEFAIQIRMYSMAVLFCTICCVRAYLTYERAHRRDLVAYTAAGLAAAYTHYFALVTVAVIAAVLLVRILARQAHRRRMGIDETMHTGASIKDWCITAAVMIVGYLPWLPTLYAQVTSVEESYWIPEITGSTVVGYFTWTFGLNESVPGIPVQVLKWGTTLFFLACLVAAGTLMLRRLSRETRINGLGLCCMLIPTIVCALGILVSVLPGRSTIYRDQYIYPALGILAISYGIGMRKLLDRSRGLAGKMTLSVIVAITLLIGALQYREVYHQEYRGSYLTETMAFLAENAGEDDPILYNFEAYGFVYEYYWDADRLHYYEEFDWDGDYDQAWLFVTAGYPVPDDAIWAAHRLGVEDMGTYGIEQNPFTIYRITHLDS